MPEMSEKSKAVLEKLKEIRKKKLIVQASLKSNKSSKNS